VTGQTRGYQPFIQPQQSSPSYSRPILFGQFMRRGTLGGDIERIWLRGRPRIEVGKVYLLIQGRSVCLGRALVGVILRRSSCVRHTSASGAGSPPICFLFSYPYRPLVRSLYKSPRYVESYSSLQGAPSMVYVGVIRGGRYSLE